MTKEEYYEILKEMHKHTDWSDLQQVKAYNENARKMRNQMEYSNKCELNQFKS